MLFILRSALQNQILTEIIYKVIKDNAKTHNSKYKKGVALVLEKIKEVWGFQDFLKCRNIINHIVKLNQIKLSFC